MIGSDDRKLQNKPELTWVDGVLSNNLRSEGKNWRQDSPVAFGSVGIKYCVLDLGSCSTRNPKAIIGYYYYYSVQDKDQFVSGAGNLHG